MKEKNGGQGKNRKEKNGGKEEDEEKKVKKMKKKLANRIFSANFHCSTFPIFQKREFNILHPPRPLLSHLRPRSFVILTNFKLTREFNFEDQCGLVFFFYPPPIW